MWIYSFTCIGLLSYSKAQALLPIWIMSNSFPVSSCKWQMQLQCWTSLHMWVVMRIGRGGALKLNRVTWSCMRSLLWSIMMIASLSRPMPPLHPLPLDCSSCPSNIEGVAKQVRLKAYYVKSVSKYSKEYFGKSWIVCVLCIYIHIQIGFTGFILWFYKYFKYEKNQLFMDGDE